MSENPTDAAPLDGQVRVKRGAQAVWEDLPASKLAATLAGYAERIAALEERAAVSKTTTVAAEVDPVQALAEFVAGRDRLEKLRESLYCSNLGQHAVIIANVYLDAEFGRLRNRLPNALGVDLSEADQ